MAKDRRNRDAPAPYPKALASRLGFLLAQAHMAARHEADRALDRVGLTMKGFAALATLASDDRPTSQRRLSQRIRMDPATMVDVIDSLEASGFIVRRRNPADRREYALELTTKGRALYRRAERSITEAEKLTNRGLDGDERQTLMRLLERVAVAHG